MYTITFITLCVISIIYLKLAERLNIIDRPNKRSSHSLPTIRGGGVLFVFAFLIYEITNGFKNVYLLTGVLIIAIISFVDDIKSLSPRFRFPFQILSVVLLVYQIDGGMSVLLFLLFMFLGTAFVNLFNFMDGINGISGMYSLSVLVGIYIVNVNTSSIIDTELILNELFAVIIFGYYNFRKKARFFAGDIGSVSIALLIFYMVITLVYNLKSPLYFLFLLVFGTDSILTILYRFVIKEKITEAHRHHIYQKLVDRTKLSHIQVSLLYALLQLVISTVVIVASKFVVKVQYILTLSLILLMVIVYCVVFRILEKENFKQSNRIMNL